MTSDILTSDFFDSVLCKAWERSRYPRDNPYSISVTEVTQCLRYSYFARVKPVCVPQVTSLLLGIEGHRVFADILGEYGWLTEKLICIARDGVRLCGRVDAYHPDLNAVVDFKFVEKPPREPYEDHVFQVQVYMAMLNAERGYVVYFSRDPRERTRVHRVFRSDRSLEKAIERAQLLSASLVLNDPPKPERGRWCRWCPYKFDCIRAGKRDRFKSG